MEKPVVIQRNIMYPRLEFRTGHLEIIVPQGANEAELLEKYADWIEEKEQFISEMLVRAEKLRYEPRTKEEFTGFVMEYVKEKLHREPKIQFRMLKTKWASCSPKGTITLNLLGKDLPKHHLEYILSHEILHLYRRKHDAVFTATMIKDFPNMEDIEKDLCGYWFKMMQMKEK